MQSNDRSGNIQAHPTTRRRRVCIIGAGMTGLAAGYRLAKAGYEVILIESTLEIGGMVSSFSLGADRIEHIYHHIFTSDIALYELADELGLAAMIEWYKPKDALYSQNRLYPFSSPLDLLRFKSIPFWQRVRTGLTVLRASHLADWESLDQQTAAEWICATGGRQAYRMLWQPLLRAKFDRDAEAISAVWIWNKFKLRGGSRANKRQAESLGYMKGSFATLVDALAKSIIGMGGQIYNGYTAMNLTREQRADGANAYRISSILEDCSSVDIIADAVISTTAGRPFSNITTSLDWPEDYRNRLQSVRYKGDLCLVMRLRQTLSPYYWTTVCDDLPFVVVVEHTNLTGVADYGGHVVYLSRYMDVTDPLWTQSDGEIFKLFADGLARMYPDFSVSQVMDWRLRRSRFAQPVVQCGYADIMPTLDTPEPGIKLAGMAQIYPEDRGMNYAIALGDKAAASVRDYLESLDPPTK